MSAAFIWSSDNYRLSQETSTSTPDSITKSYASCNITIAVNKIKFISVFFALLRKKRNG